MKNKNEVININRNSMGIRIVGFILSIVAGWIDTIGVKLFLKSNFKMFIGIVLISYPL